MESGDGTGRFVSPASSTDSEDRIPYRIYLKNEPALAPVPDSSFELPDTGRSGAAAFYIAGMALAASVLVPFFARKRRET